MPSDRDRPDEDLDAAFAAIIADWDDIPSLDDEQGRSDRGTDDRGTDDRGTDDRGIDDRGIDDGRSDNPSTDKAGRPDEPPTPRRRSTDALPDPQAHAEPAGPRDWVAPEDPDDDRYHPPDPPPLPKGDLVGLLAWAGVLLGPAFLLFAGVFWRGAPRMWLALAVLAFVGGFVTLVLRLPADRDDSDGDDGAVV
jgi:hypothetical protein